MLTPELKDASRFGNLSMRELSNVRIVCLTLATAGRLIPSGAKEGF